MPSDHNAHREWLGGVIKEVDNKDQELHPVIQEFKEMIETNARVYMLLESMFEEVPKRKPYCTDKLGNPQVRNSECLQNDRLMTYARSDIMVSCWTYSTKSSKLSPNGRTSP